VAPKDDDLPYVRLTGRQPHGARARAILRAHPEIRALMGPEPWSFVAVLGVVTAQLAIAYALRDAPAWALVLAAYTIGSVLLLGTFELLHACAHHNIFPSHAGSRFAAYVGNIAVIWPVAESFLRYHKTHHRYLGEYERDVSLPRRWELALDRLGPFGKALWLASYPLVYPLRVHVMQRGARLVDRFTALNVLLQLAAALAIHELMGGRALFYLALTFPCAAGLNITNANTVTEHFLVNGEQESYSYYGPLNLVTFNVGYHNEHHDFPNIPWSRVHKLRRIAPEFYDTLHSYDSWTRLVVAFVLDRRWSLALRGIRPPPPETPPHRAGD
jgi:sphingolipid delta-4 desaturase